MFYLREVGKLKFILFRQNDLTKGNAVFALDLGSLPAYFINFREILEKRG